MKVGSLFTGYGGLDLAVGGDLAWYAEIEPAACQVLEAHHPGVPNLGDITQIDWSTVPPVDVITGGYPCQPFSSAGLRKGKDDERHLWPYVRDAIRTLGPRYAILENVRGHLTLGFADVLADLADIGWDAEWAVVAAADIGAPHKRERIFIVAYPESGAGWAGCDESEAVGGAGDNKPSGGRQGSASDTSSRERRPEEHSHLREAIRPTTESGKRTSQNWGQYEPAIRRWEHILGRPAPDPTVMGSTGRPRLNPVFVEWMMGLPLGHVTGHELSTAQCLKMLGNGVVPQQANYAITQLFERIQ
jgi:DNA (cytosine-5)-methyltransferase 1